MIWQKRLVVLGVLTLCSMEASSVLAHDNSVVEEVLEVLRTNGQITEQQYQQLMGKTKSAQGSSSSKEKQASPKATVGYKPGRGFQFESADGKHTLLLVDGYKPAGGILTETGERPDSRTKANFRSGLSAVVARPDVFP